MTLVLVAIKSHSKIEQIIPVHASVISEVDRGVVTEHSDVKARTFLTREMKEFSLGCQPHFLPELLTLHSGQRASRGPAPLLWEFAVHCIRLDHYLGLC